MAFSAVLKYTPLQALLARRDSASQRTSPDHVALEKTPGTGVHITTQPRVSLCLPGSGQTAHQFRRGTSIMLHRRAPGRVGAEHEGARESWARRKTRDAVVREEAQTLASSTTTAPLSYCSHSDRFFPHEKRGKRRRATIAHPGNSPFSHRALRHPRRDAPLVCDQASALRRRLSTLKTPEARYRSLSDCCHTQQAHLSLNARNARRQVARQDAGRVPLLR
jgi:hypothetical protein